MRKISAAKLLSYFAWQALALLLAAALWVGALWPLPLGEFRGVALTAGGILLFYLCTILVYRLFLRVVPLRTGVLEEGSKGEFAAQVNALFYLFVFNSLLRSGFIPIPLMRLICRALGARMGANTYSGGLLLDPPLTVLGDHVLVGSHATLFCHTVEGARYELDRIVVGSHVTIGANAILMPGVTVGDGAMISAGAVVPKGTRIGPGEVWGGVPARPLRAAKPKSGWAEEMAPVPDTRPAPSLSPRPLAADYS